MKHTAFFLLTLSSLPLIGAPDCSKSCHKSCIGPENYAVNPPVRPYTCNGDFEITASLLYWKANEDGLEYAVKTSPIDGFFPQTDTTLIDAHYLNPHFDWNFGYKIGLGYYSSCDGWDYQLLWTHYDGKAGAHNQATVGSDTLLFLWSNFRKAPNDPPVVNSISSNWSLDLNLVDLELGRTYWNSRLLNLRPHIGLRLAYLDQDLSLFQSGGVFAEATPPVNDEVEIDQDCKGVGPRFGLDSFWSLGCGFSLYGNFAFSLLYSRYHVNYDESTREVTGSHAKSKILDLEESFRNNFLAADFSLGIQYLSLLCDCDYVLSVALGWESQLFLNQNQMWRIVATGFSGDPSTDNSYQQSRGDLSTQGWTLKVVFDF